MQWMSLVVCVPLFGAAPAALCAIRSGAFTTGRTRTGVLPSGGDNRRVLLTMEQPTTNHKRELQTFFTLCALICVFLSF